MVDQIGGFVDHRLAVAGDGLDDRLDGLLADLLCDLVHAVREEPRRVGAFGHRGVALADDGLQAADEPLGFGHGLAEAALMFTCWCGLSSDQKSYKAGYSIYIYRNICGAHYDICGCIG